MSSVIVCVSPQIGHDGSFLIFSSRKFMLKASKSISLPIKGVPIPVINLIASVACITPTTPGKMPSTPPSAQDGTMPGKMQYGTSWWFLDQKDGMEKQINALSNLGLLSRFIGMLTDSRSFLSYSRHEYFRRILCNLIGTDVENGELPNDIDHLGNIVEDICFNNAVDYFGFSN